MALSQNGKIEEIIDTTEEHEDGSGSEPDDDEHGQAGIPGPAEPSTSSKKKKKKSKAMKALNALRGKHEIPQAVVTQVLDKVKAEGGPDAAGADEASVRAALEQMKIMDVAQGKAGIGGKNKKDMGEHKVCNSNINIAHWSYWSVVLGNTTCPTVRYEEFISPGRSILSYL